MPEKPRPFDPPETHLAAYFREREMNRLRDRLAERRTTRMRFGLDR